MTNFGHVALRVYGNGYDKTYDFGRYRGGRGFLRAKGPGILRVWTKFDSFKAGQEAKGKSRAVNFTTTKAQDKQAMQFFQAKIVQATRLADNPEAGYVEFQLEQDYDLKSNNCTTICVDAIQGVEGLEEEGEALEGHYDPRALFELLERLFAERDNAVIINLK